MSKDKLQESMSTIPVNRSELAAKINHLAWKFYRDHPDATYLEAESHLVPEIVMAVPPSAFDALQPVDDGILIFHGEVGTDEVQDFQHDLLRTHMNLTPGKPITLLLSSFGGSVYAGLALSSTIYGIQREGRIVNIHVQGAAMSMAAGILQTANRRSMESLATLMLHKISYGIQGSTDEHQEQLKEADRINERLFSLYTMRTGKPPGYYLTKLKRRNWFLGSDEALAEGLIDEITEPPLYALTPPESTARKSRPRRK